MLRISRALTSLVLVALCALALGACGGGKKSSSVSTGAVSNPNGKHGGSLVFARAVQAGTLDPNVGQSDAGTIQTQIQIFDQLTEILPGSAEVKPGLAKSWDISGDGLTYTFHLRDAKFSDGSPVTSADVKFSLDRVLNPKVDASFAGLFDFVKSVSTTDPRTVVVKLKHRFPAFLAYLSFNVPSIVSKAYFEKVGEKRFATHPLGSGAFKVASFRPGQDIVLERNPYYWRKGLPYLDKVTVRYIPDDNARVLALRSGSADLADDIPFSQVKSLDGAGLSTLVKQISAEEFIILNEKAVPQLRSTAVRQALNYATPREAINKVVFAGLGQISNSMLPKIKYHDDSVKPYPYDLQKAKSLMAKAGVSGFSLDLTQVAGDSAARQITSILQNSWGKIGVKLSARPLEFATMYDALFKYDYQAMIFQPTASSSDVPTDDELAQGFLGPSLNSFFTYYKNQKVFKLINQVVQTPDEGTRRQLFSEIQRDTMADPPFVSIVFTPGRAAFKPKVKGFDYVTTNWFRLDQVSLG